MKHELANFPEMIKKPAGNIPTIEAFFDPSRLSEVLTEDIASKESFKEQIEERKILNKNLDSLIKDLQRPDISLREAIDKGHISIEQAARTYESLADLLGSDDYKRIALYLPFEFMPDKNWDYSSERLQSAADRFKKNYMDAWEKLLSSHDIRANFVDGDIPESAYHTGAVPRVVKAAHLIPKLVEKGMLEIREVMSFIEATDDTVLKESIADTFPVLADLGFLLAEEIEIMKKSKDSSLNRLAQAIDSSMESKKRETIIAPEKMTFSHIKEALNNDLVDIHAKDYGDITEKRKNWLIQEQERESIEALGKDIGTGIGENMVGDELFENSFYPETSLAMKQAVIEGIRTSIVSASLTDASKAQMLYSKYGKNLLALWKDNFPGTKESLQKTFRHLNRISIIGDDTLKELGIDIPKLSGPFSENIRSIEKDILILKEKIRLLESDPDLSKSIYPAVLINGSHIKGYGSENSDIDISVFIRPGTPLDKRDMLRASLEKIFMTDRIHPPILEFWLEEKGTELSIRDFSEPDESFGDSYMAGSLFGAIWEGNHDAINDLRKKLLIPYMREDGKKLHGKKARNIYIEELEREFLQYRLMHKGYEKNFPPYGGIHTKHSNKIDGNSVFWDSGYRQLATKLYASRVFLPKITE